MTFQEKSKKSSQKTSLNKSQHAQYQVKTEMTLDDHPKIKGYDFGKEFNITQFLNSFATTGFQASHLAQGIEIVKAMQREKATIFLTCTSNMISSGLREIIKYLVKNKKIDVLVTSAGGVEEDIIKSLEPFALGQFDVPGSMLFEHGVNRIGNIFVPNNRYTKFDQFMQEFFPKLKSGLSPNEFCKELGQAINNEDSILYWAAKNEIPIFCPGIIDGSIGDLLVFFKQTHPNFVIDVTKEVEKITKIALNCEKSAIIALGGGISKHFALNANIFREGVDFAVYINTAQEYDGCDSGARIEEAISWGKVKVNAPHVKIHCDATIAFPLLIAGVETSDSENL
jgi:deoxyhypusine synthase